MTSRGGRRALDEDVLARAAEDSVTPGDVFYLVRDGVGLVEPDEIRDMSIGLVGRLILTGLVVPCDMTNDGVQAWSGTAGDAIARITTKWLSFDDPGSVMPGDIFWLDATEDGIRRGEAVWRREGSPPLRRPRPNPPALPMKRWRDDM